ncbi:uncharacterized protein LOC118433061 [Folsomia candida]|uniref:uncharacterized protein LOC118433061 n=1 Tax=Folsomia candida TaxID=158441 RepID=UPI001604C746|nr:uncharacterized protein LOC118433061 [Folsomia candida]
MGSFYPIFSLLIVTLLPNYSTSQTLTVEKSVATLPYLSCGVASVYDGDDNIFIFGGYDGVALYSDKILKYSISADNLTIVSQFPWGVGFGAVLAGRTNTSYFYIGGEDDRFKMRRDSSEIFEFNSETNAVAVVGYLPYPQFAPGAVKTDRNTGLIVLAGEWFEESGVNEILKFDMETFTLTTVGGLLADLMYFSTIRDPVTGNVWVFGVEQSSEKAITSDRKPSIIQPVEKYNPSTNLSEVWYLNFPQIERLVSLTSDGLSCYLIGGYAQENNNETILQFNPLTHSFTSISVLGLPKNSNSIFFTSSVYARKLNRIYVIGGYLMDFADPENIHAADEILWMDLSPLQN